MEALIGVFAIPMFFTKGKKHWLTIQSEKDNITFRLDKKNYQMVLATMDNKPGVKIEREID